MYICMTLESCYEICMHTHTQLVCLLEELICHNLCEFIIATTLLFPENTVS